MKKQIAKLLRRWADSLAPSPRPSLIINSHNVKRFKFRRMVSPFEVEERAHRLYGRRPQNISFHEARTRTLDIIKQETIVEAAVALSALLTIEEHVEQRELVITGDFYFIPNEETKI